MLDSLGRLWLGDVIELLHLLYHICKSGAPISELYSKFNCCSSVDSRKKFVRIISLDIVSDRPAKLLLLPSKIREVEAARAYYEASISSDGILDGQEMSSSYIPYIANWPLGRRHC